MPGVQRIGICGGTFDPIHLGHLVVAEEICAAMKLDRVIFIPSGNPPHKKGLNVTNAEDRLEMVTIATSHNPFFEVSDMEVKRGGYTYTVDTLTELRSGPYRKAKLFFIIGADVVHELLTWKDYKKVFTLCEFIAILRPGYGKKCFMEAIEELHELQGAIIHTVNAPLIGISSTDIRERMLMGKPIKYLVPEEVEKYIYSHGLYK